MDTFEVILLFGGIVVLVLLLLRWPVRSPLGQLLPRGRVQPLHTVRQGRVYVRGHARAMEVTLEGPLSGERVLGYRVLVEQRDGPHHWSLLLEHSEVTDFELVAEGAAATVTGAGAVLLLGREIRLSRRPGANLPAVVKNLLLQHCQYTPADRDAMRFRWSEFHVTDGDEVHVGAEASVVPACDGRQLLGGGVYRGTPSTLVLGGSPERPLVIIDRDREALLGLIARPQGERLIPRR